MLAGSGSESFHVCFQRLARSQRDAKTFAVTLRNNCGRAFADRDLKEVTHVSSGRIILKSLLNSKTCMM